jgi:hypothetical protein
MESRVAVSNRSGLSPLGGAYNPSSANGREATRLLCAGAYLDNGFCEQVTQTVFREPHRAAAPAHGIDVGLVATHAVAAHQHYLKRNAFLLLAVIIGYVIGGESFRWALLFGAMLIFADRLYVRHRIIGRKFSRAEFREDSAATLDPERQAQLEKYLAQAHGNVTVYSGFTPFVGEGTLIGGWSFAINLSRGKRAFNNGETDDRLDVSGPGGARTPPRPCDLPSLYARIRSAAYELGFSNLAIEDRLFVSGQDVRLDESIFPADARHPATHLAADDLSAYAERPGTTARYYQCLRVTDWSGELALSIVLRMRIVGENLFVEASYLLMTPIKEEFRNGDARSPFVSLSGVVGEAVYAGLATPFIALGVVFSVLNFVPARIRQAREEGSIERRTRDDPSFDFGAVQSVRQLGAAPDVRRYFQRLDKEMYVKILERRILDSLTDYLDEHGVDTSDLREREATILNQGVIVSGSVTAETFVGGKGATAMIQQKVLSTARRASAVTTQVAKG